MNTEYITAEEPLRGIRLFSHSFLKRFSEKNIDGFLRTSHTRRERIEQGRHTRVSVTKRPRLHQVSSTIAEVQVAAASYSLGLLICLRPSLIKDQSIKSLPFICKSEKTKTGKRRWRTRFGLTHRNSRIRKARTLAISNLHNCSLSLKNPIVGYPFQILPIKKKYRR